MVLISIIFCINFNLLDLERCFTGYSNRKTNLLAINQKKIIVAPVELCMYHNLNIFENVTNRIPRTIPMVYVKQYVLPPMALPRIRGRRLIRMSVCLYLYLCLYICISERCKYLSIFALYSYWFLVVCWLPLSVLKQK